MTTAYATSLAMTGGGEVVARGELVSARVRLFITAFFSTYLLIFRSLIEVRSQNQDDPTAYVIRHDISQNQRSGWLVFSSMLKTNLLTDLFVLYSILKNYIHTGKSGQGPESKT